MATKGQPFEFSVSLFSQATGQVLLSPTIAAADFEISTDGGSYASLTNTPTVTPASSGLVAFDLTASEVGNEKFSIKMIDSVGSQWETMFYHETVTDLDNVADSVWDASLSSHTTAGSTGKALKQLKEGTISADGDVDDASATASTFITTLTAAVDGFYHDKVLVFVQGSLLGQARHIEDYDGTTKSVTVSEPFSSAPADGDEFLILAGHEHSVGEIAGGVWSEAQASYTTVGTFGYFLDARVSDVTSGTGANTVTITVNDGSSPLENAAVDMKEGANNYTGLTDASGEVVFNLDNATYTVAIYKAGYSFAGASIAITGTTAQTYSMSQISIPTTSDPNTVTAYINLYDENGVKEGLSCSAELVSPPDALDGYGYVPLYQSGTSSATGLFSFEAFKGGTYKLILNGVESHVLIPAAASDPYQLPSYLAGC